MKHERRKWITGTLAIARSLTVAVARTNGILPARALHQASLEAERDCKPLLLEFAATDCRYCHLLEVEVLNPTLLNRDYDRRGRKVAERMVGLTTREFYGSCLDTAIDAAHDALRRQPQCED